MEEEILTKEDVAKFLKVDIRTVRHYLYTKQIPAFRCGKEYRFLKSEIIKWIKQRMEGQGLSESLKRLLR
ncbi:MAG: helix-turn-helix domain-containing protein [Candidatus Saganbacteria bacterium]|nr:helix-turn-helix domain-containing protein [Candidatus Saganbacteria bacterium]